MPRATANKLYRTFVKGLITEAGPLTYPEDASINEDNMVLSVAGTRKRRKGIQNETNGIGYTTVSVPTDGVAITEFVWKSVANNASLNFNVLQTGRYLTFTDNTASTMSTTAKSFNIDLNAFAVNSADPTDTAVQMACGKGLLFVVGAKTDPFYVVYDPTTDNIAVQRIYIQIRDFKGVDDGLANDEEPTSLSNTHQFNLMNQGWLDPANDASGASVTQYSFFGVPITKNQASTAVITSYFTTFSRYPGNNKQWWIAKDATTNAFKPDLLAKFYMGTGRAPRGHYIVDAFNIDRSAVSGVASIPVEKTNSRPTAVAFANGRVWYGCESTIYFSQVLDDKRKAGMCYMEADPTSENINDLVATDGGVIPIPDMIKVNRLLPIGGGILCFSTNGLWYVTGGSGGFSALDMSIGKVTPIGTESPFSVVHIQDANTDQVLYWSKVGIIGIQQRVGQFGTIDGKFDTSILTQETIQTFYNAIPKTSIQYVKSHYDTSTNVVQWLFNSGGCPYIREFDRILNFDLTLKAFYPWTVIPTNTPAGPYLAGVLETTFSTGNRMAFTKYVQANHNSGTTWYTFAEESNLKFKDWDQMTYLSFIETGYELMNDAMRYKQALYVYTYFRRTEQNYVPSGLDWTPDTPSSCYLQVKWDWSDTSTSNRWSNKFQAYRVMRYPPLDEANPIFDTGFAIVTNRHKIRGHGKAIQFRFENNEAGSDFDLLGWSVPYSGNTNP